MQICFIYLIIGSALTIMACDINSLPSEDSEETNITNSDKVVYILLWPLILAYIFYKLKK